MTYATKIDGHYPAQRNHLFLNGFIWGKTICSIFVQVYGFLTPRGHKTPPDSLVRLSAKKSWRNQKSAQ